MIVKLIEQLVDDVDGNTDDVQPRELTIKGVRWRVDLGGANREEFDALVAARDEAQSKLEQRMRQHGRKLREDKAPKLKAGRERTVEGDRERAEIRGWANQNGFQVAERGRIPIVVLEAYAAAH